MTKEEYKEIIKAKQEMISQKEKEIMEIKDSSKELANEYVCSVMKDKYDIEPGDKIKMTYIHKWGSKNEEYVLNCVFKGGNEHWFGDAIPVLYKLKKDNTMSQIEVPSYNIPRLEEIVKIEKIGRVNGI